MTEHTWRASLLVTTTVMCASLYALGSYTTAYIPSPWGFGQFRPAVVIPSLFAVIFGPLPAAVGAAIGTLIADSVKHGYLYLGSLIAAVPGNFIGFYLFGVILKGRFSWSRFISASLVTLTVANLIVAFLYVFIFKALYLHAFDLHPESLSLLVYLSVGLTIWWFVTMLPFVLLVTPALIRAVVKAVPSIVPEDVRTHSLSEDFPKLSFSLALIIPGTVMLSVGLLTTFTALGVYTTSLFGGAISSMIELMYYISGFTLLLLGFIIVIRQRIFKPK